MIRLEIVEAFLQKRKFADVSAEFFKDVLNSSYLVELYIIYSFPGLDLFLSQGSILQDLDNSQLLS